MPQTRKRKSLSRYAIHNNYSHPFYVDVEGNTATIWKNMDTVIRQDGKFIDVKKPEKKVKIVSFQQIFLGKKSKTGKYLSPAGNTILLKLSNKRYMYIGMQIYEFDVLPGDEIISFYSDIGNNDVPYSYAMGKVYVYLTSEQMAVEKTVLDEKKDLYGQYYGFIPGKLSHAEIKSHSKKIKTKVISK